MRTRQRQPRLFVVGNGPSGIGDDGSYHVDRGCGHLLDDLAEIAQLSFAQPVEPVAAGLNYYGYILSPRRVTTIGLDRGAAKILQGAIRLLWAFWRADLIYLFYPGTLPKLIARLCLFLDKPYGVFLRGGQLGNKEGIDGRVLRKARFVMTVSETLAGEAEAFNRDVTVVRSSRDLDAGEAHRRGLPSEAGSRLRLLFVGRIDAEKGVPELIEAAKTLHAEGLDFEMSLIGLGALGEPLARELADARELPVHLAGEVTDRAAVMNAFDAADIFILPSHHEGFARVLYEAMLKSCAIITTMVGGIPAVMKDRENCLAIPVNDSDAIAAAVRELARDRELRQRIGARGLDTVLSVIEKVPTHFDALQEKLGTLRAA